MLLGQCMCIPHFQVAKNLTDFHETWYEYCAIEISIEP
jgi:hypothetical protein